MAGLPTRLAARARILIVAGALATLAIGALPATAAAANTRGRPDRGRSTRPASRCSQNRFRHRDTTSICTPTSAAMSTFAQPSAASNTIRARTTCRWGPL